MIPPAVPRYHGPRAPTVRTARRQLAIHALLQQPQRDKPRRVLERCLRETVLGFDAVDVCRAMGDDMAGRALLVTWTDRARIVTVLARPLCSNARWEARR